MSLTVLVVPEDPTYNGAILKPLVERILKQCGKGSAKVTVLTEPKVSGFDDAVRSMPGIAREFRHVDLLLFLPDADGRGTALNQSLAALQKEIDHNCFLYCAAVEEIETWLLAGHKDKLPVPWGQVRSEVSVKERFFRALLREHGSQSRQDEGREALMRETLKNYKGLKESCPELKELEKLVCEAVAGL